MPDEVIYLDNHATTRVDPRVVEAMLPYFTERYGNASSASHAFGWEAGDAVDRAREQVAGLIGAEPPEIVFTSGATEANNLAIKGTARAHRGQGGHLVCSAVEHRAVLDPMRRLAREEGWSLSVVPCDPDGRISPEAVAEAITDRTALVSVMAANNEVGTINPIREIGRLCRERGVTFHTDASQAVGKIPVDLEEVGADLLSLTAHKFHGPKGIGALFVRRRGARARLVSLVDGGGHERGLRSGTLPVPLIVALGRAAELAAEEGPSDAIRMARLRDRLEDSIRNLLEDQGIRRHGREADRLPNNLSLGFEGVEGEALLMAIRGVAASPGAACSSAEPGPSHVLRAMGVGERLAGATLRFGLGRFTTEGEVDRAGRLIAEAVRRLRAGGGPEGVRPSKVGHQGL
ncbi:cysteine desulfurase family protein [Tautonia plasticadhaerens]|uniref:cysteine desulfurase n=1 Tax=Tautonia plasticadhaerens TaxID=2527974 RepID=A0A518H7M6_9BACT|nr:cysteine desulfurase family protein [Tautonia plasticadhaerens]QDV36860.1 Cysteine desulfurase [Tautonia plasticadhaerens]